MNAGTTAERVYEALRWRVIGGSFAPGDRLDPASLADRLSSSVTPVRDALHRLVGERLVVARVSEGFHLPPLDQIGLVDLFDWLGQLLLLAKRASVFAAQAADASVWPEDPHEHAARAAALFEAIGAASPNAEHQDAIRAAVARLYPVLLVETQALGELAREMTILSAQAATADHTAFRRVIGAYVRRRARIAPDLVRLLYRRGRPAE